MSQGTQRANTKRIYHVSAKDLPLSCPTKDMRVWDAHPKVYLPIEASGKAVCPYCDAEFILEDNDK
ncbi:MAG: hypothetical protein CMF50_01440 [Legionellales bacterium]|nr:hypothetical protein [Legionellales bacterium]|tara:strand:+ start:27325 stop:27522 length:198 start_codon:yes stop_codon:yes gene_type:complete